MLLIGRPTAPAVPVVAAPGAGGNHSAPPVDPVAPQTRKLADGRTAQVVGLAHQHGTALVDRIAGELGAAADAVTAFWGPDWRRDIVVVVAGSDAQFSALAGAASTSDIAAVTTGDRILFAPGAAAMTAPALRIVLRHELFHYAARAATAADAPRWLTEGVADYVARPAPGAPAAGDVPTRLPTDADLDTAGPVRSLAYDRAWLFSRYVADRYGAPELRALYARACGNGHPDVATAVQDTLGVSLAEAQAGWRNWPAR